MYKLYYRPECPFCQKVLEFVSERGLSVELRDIADQVNLDKLMELGGNKQVPFLVDEEKDFSLYESDDIIEYLKREH